MAREGKYFNLYVTPHQKEEGEKCLLFSYSADAFFFFFTLVLSQMAG